MVTARRASEGWAATVRISNSSAPSWTLDSGDGERAITSRLIAEAIDADALASLVVPDPLSLGDHPAVLELVSQALGQSALTSLHLGPRVFYLLSPLQAALARLALRLIVDR
jgi:hypothetical protein